MTEERSIEQDIRSLMPSRYTMWLGGKLEELVDKARDKMEVNIILTTEEDIEGLDGLVTMNFDIPENKVLSVPFDDKIMMIAGSTRAHDGGVRPLTTEYRLIGFTMNLDEILSRLSESAYSTTGATILASTSDLEK